MYFAEYFWDEKCKEPALGDRSVFILDGRNSLDTMVFDAKEFGKRHDFSSFHIRQGDRFTHSMVVSINNVIQY